MCRPEFSGHLRLLPSGKTTMVEVNNQTKNKIPVSLIKKVTDLFLKVYKKQEFEVSIVIVGDCAIKKLNHRYRKQDRITDILAFPGIADDKFFGEIIINYAQIKRQAKLYSKNAQEELIFILVHGLLHLLGLRDDTEKGKKEMIKEGKKFIKIYDKHKKIV